MLWNYAEFDISVNSDELSVQYWSGYPQYLFSYLSKSWLIQCVRNNAGTCLWDYASVYICVSLLSLYICVTGNCSCYELQVSLFYCNSSIYSLYLFPFCKYKSMVLPCVLKWHLYNISDMFTCLHTQMHVKNSLKWHQTVLMQ